MIKRIALIIGVVIVSMQSMHGQSVFDKSDPNQFFTIGARIGFNTSSNSFPNTPTTLYNNNSWGTGFDAGLVASLNIKNYLSIQPGFFFESRSGNYSYLYWYNDYYGKYQEHWDMGHYRSFNFTVPIMAIVKFDVLDKLTPMLEVGPYFQYSFKNTGIDNEIPFQLPQTTAFSSYKAEKNKIDIGVKMGVGMEFLKHYYIGVHYLAGACKVWKQPSGGKNKEWMFTIGYDI